MNAIDHERNSSVRRLRVLLTEGSSLSARHTLNAIGRQHDVEVADSGYWKIGHASHYVRKWHRVPPYQTQPEAFIERLETLCVQRGFDVLLPTHEETFVVSRFQERLAKHVQLAVPAFDRLEQLQSKARFSELLRRLNLPQPETTVLRSPAELAAWDSFPVFVKRSMSTASQGVMGIRDRCELTEAMGRMDQAGWFTHQEEILVQEWVQGIESAAIGLFQHGKLVGFHGMEEWAKGSLGMPISRRSRVHPDVLEHTRRLGEELSWHGPFCLAYFYDPQRESVRYIECNPRIGETFNGVLSGINLCELWLRIALEESLEMQPLPQEHVHSYCGFLVLLAQAVDGASRWKLLKQFGDWIRGAGYYRGENELIRVREDWLSAIPMLVVTGLLLAYPRGGRWLVKDTVSRYALSEAAAQAVRELGVSAKQDSR